MVLMKLLRCLSTTRTCHPPHAMAFLLGICTSIYISGPGQFTATKGRQLMGLRLTDELGTHNGMVAGQDHRNKTLDAHTAPLIDDSKYHHDNSSIADRLKARMPIFCAITTNFAHSGEHVKTLQETWGKRCDHLIVTSTKAQEVTLRDNLTAVHLNSTIKHKTRFSNFFQTIDYLCPGICSDHPWFLIAGDTSYIILENLRLLILNKSPDDLVYAELTDSVDTAMDYPALLSRGALQALAKRNASLCTFDKDEAQGCLEKVGIQAIPTKDSLGRSRVHSRTPFNYATSTVFRLSDIAISFHTSSSNYWFKRNLEFYIYHLRPYGIKMGLYHDDGNGTIS